MARSRRKSPYTGWTTAKSEKYDKTLARKKLRVATRKAFATDAELFPELRDVSDVWLFMKDGRQRITDERYMRK